ncbi:MAG: OsmC family protein [Candidatus Omnitrophica bacterium]|nr:OsmC family protein [Candidatus Omnitrophota bacterium]
MEVVVDYSGSKRFLAHCGKHDLIVDLPVNQGGKDEGPTPPQYFLASLASCVGVYVLSFCNNYELNASGMQIKICADKLAAPARLENIKTEIVLPKANIGERKQELLAVARRCLVHNTIEAHPKIDIKLIIP